MDIRTWAAAHLEDPGEFELVRQVPWSATLRVAAKGGVYWAKANSPGCAYEAGLAELLGRRVPGDVVVPLAADRERGWLLTADQGPTLRETPATDRLAAWGGLITAYGVPRPAVLRLG